MILTDLSSVLFLFLVTVLLVFVRVFSLSALLFRLDAFKEVSLGLANQVDVLFITVILVINFILE